MFFCMSSKFCWISDACMLSCSDKSDSLGYHGLWPPRFLCPWDFPGKNTGIGGHFLLQGIFLTQWSNWSLLHWWAGSLLLSQQGGPWISDSMCWFVVADVQLLSHDWLFVTPWTAAPQTFLSFIVFWNLLKFLSIELVMPSNHLILCSSLLLLPSIFPSITVSFNESALHIRWPKCWSFSFDISPSNEYSGLISFRIDWLDLLTIQRTLESLFQHHSSKASILWCSAIFMVQLSHLYMTTGKTTTLTRQTFARKVMSVIFNTLSRF